jgi:glycosyltransferase involved in cell wall biosynthesis
VVGLGSADLPDRLRPTEVNPMRSAPNSEALRLILVTETFPPDVNGVARTLGRWVDAFRSRGHEVAVVRPRRPGEKHGPLLVPGMRLPFYPQVRVGMAGPLRLRTLFRTLEPDLVHIATEGPLGCSALLAGRWLGIPVASSFHTNFDHYASHYGFLGWEWLLFRALRWFHNSTLVTLVPSQATRQRLLQSGMERVEIWSRGVDAELFHPRHRDPALRRELGLSETNLLILYVGRLAPEKNLQALLQAFVRLRSLAAKPLAARLRLGLVGAGPMKEQVQRSAVPGVIVAGEKHGLELSRWFASGDLFAFPSLSETFGNVVLEAQASGLPVVGYDCQGVNERVSPEEDGLLVPVEGDLATALLRLCQDDATRLRFGRAARAKAEQQDWRPIFDDLERRYRQLVLQHGQRRTR